MKSKTTGAAATAATILKRATFGAVVALATATTPVLAQTFSFNSFNVEGNQRIETGTILTLAGIQPGQPLSAAELNDAAQAIRASGLFESVEVTPRGGTLVIEVVEFPTINRINFEGNSRLSDSDLAPLISSRERRVFDPNRAERDAAAIAATYAERGRINAVVTPQIIERSDNRVDLVFAIAEGGLTEVERVSFVGNTQYSDRRLRSVLETKQAGLLRFLIQRDTFVEDRIAFDRQVLTDFYLSRGYIDFRVESVDVSLTRERDAYLITFNVQEGQRYRLGNVDVVSEIARADASTFADDVRARTGNVYSPVLLENDIARLEREAIRQGLNFVQVEPRITRNDRDLTLDVTYALVDGPRIFIERIDIEGNTTTLDRVVRDQFTSVEGDPFNPREIRQSAERIRALGFFRDADVNARQGSSPDQVVIDVDVVEAPTGSLSFGANFNTDVGFSILASFRERNFLGRGQQLNFELSTAETNRILSLDFVEPSFLARDVAFGLSLDYQTTDQENALYDTETFRLSPSLTFPVSEQGRLQVNYAFESSDLFDYTGTGDIIAAEAATGRVNTNAIGYSYSFDNRRSGLDPDTAVVLRFGQEFGIGEDVQFVDTSVLAAAERMILGDDVTLRATFEGGALIYNEGESRVIDRYFLNSRRMRGFAAGGIGPRECEGVDCGDVNDALGGNYFAVVRLEAEFPIGLPEEFGIRGGAFFDYGSVWESGYDAADVLYDDFTPRAVVGVSILWDTPIGPLRFNFSEAIDKQEFDEVQNFDLTISTTF